ncbi:MAG: hypothetical protein JO312_08915 [Hyphomicrobiales bacterium]|nr:hypothetical protein [Hyphomicrobiales bacterium]
MTADWLYDVDIWILGVGSIAAFLACAEAGQWIGARFRSQETDRALTVITATQAATLGLFAILIGFSFSTAMTLYEQRRALLLDEANAIGTTDLRAQMLPQPYAADARRLLRDYVGVRLSFHRDSDDDAKFAQAIEASTKLHDELWRQASAASALEPLSVPTGLYVQSLNEMIDLHAKNLDALRTRVPASSILMLYAIGLAGLGLIGYESGLSSVRRSFPTMIAALLLAGVILVVVDLDRPRRGLIVVGMQPLVDLEASMGAEKAASDTQ